MGNVGYVSGFNCTEQTVEGVPESKISKIESLKAKMDQITPCLADNFRRVQDEHFELFLKKNLDYGSKNITAGLELKDMDEVKFVLSGLWYRLLDKVNRWQNIILKDHSEVSTETLVDIFQDVANYATIAELVYKNEWVS